MESVILSSPLIAVLYLVSLVLSGYGAVKQSFAVTAAAMLLFVGNTAYALICGATLYETGTVAVLFFAVQLAVRMRGR